MIQQATCLVKALVVAEELLNMTVGCTIIASDLEKLGGLDVFCLLCATIRKIKFGERLNFSGFVL